MFEGRYGNDYLNRALAMIAAVFTLVNWLLRPDGMARSILLGLSLACFGIFLFRMFSRNFEARRRENAAFLRFYLPLQNRFRSWRSGAKYAPRAKRANGNPTFAERRKYKYFACTQCAQRLRVPRGKGTLRVTCARCGNKFEIKS